MTHLRNTIVRAESGGLTTAGTEPVTCPKETAVIFHGSSAHMVTELPADKDKGFVLPPGEFQ